MAYRVAVCDDSPEDAGFVETILGEWAADRNVEIQAETFSSAESFLFRYAEDKASPKRKCACPMVRYCPCPEVLMNR